MTRASGVGSWPGTRPREAVVAVRDLLGDGVPHLPELPARGVGADMVGRAAALLEGLHVETQPYGWRFADRPGKDEGRAAAFLREDLDELAEAYDGWTGPLKVQVTGPWTLGASIELARGERAVADHGARRDLAGSLAEGLRSHIADVERLVPGADLVVQIDEPGLPAVLEGRLPTQSGYGRLRAVDRAEVRDGLREVLAAAGERPTVVHCCAGEVPVQLLRESGARAISLDISLIDGARWEQLAEAVEAGVVLWAGAVPTTGGDWRTARDLLVGAWQRIGLPMAALGDLVVTPTCGLAGPPPSSAVSVVRTTTDLAAALTDLAVG
ncbi:methionine synthase [Janibacter sp. Soil728]|uniref:methionine synthase n=1 Tax=Janibacter sp. Soil728 TaxID=1736393 RepID=UPI0007009A9D|nr:methionine synthase [Janibacter sp. Soil728]KRE38578.1 methionine synthase [Janibacter sp. Soil728]